MIPAPGVSVARAHLRGALAVVLAGAACGDPVGPTTPTNVAGTYELRTIDGQGAPWVLTTDGLDTRIAQSWTLAGDGTSTYRIIRRTADGSAVVATGAGVHWTLIPAGAQAARGETVLRTTNDGAPSRYYQALDYRVERTRVTTRLVLTSPGYPVYVYERVP